MQILFVCECISVNLCQSSFPFVAAGLQQEFTLVVVIQKLRVLLCTVRITVRDSRLNPLSCDITNCVPTAT